MTVETLSVKVTYPTTAETVKPATPPSGDGAAAWKKAYMEDRKKHWEQVFQVGEHSPYDKKKKPPQFDALREALYEAIYKPGSFVSHMGQHVRKIDADFRGGKDIGGAKERLERVAAFSGVIALFTAFDYATSKPLEKLFPVVKKDAKLMTPDDLRFNARVGGMKKVVEVLNDKYATALGNMLVEHLSGKRGYIHEVADKGADTLQVGFEKTNDLVNGATLESYMRIISQVPIAGALFEQVVTRLSMLQEKSSLHTATGKMLYMGLGVFIRNNREADKMDGAELSGLLARSIT
ncbi:hypothetical protein HZB58_05675 [Candidatus Gottesmanbacteria bacterium]|nr:hypothetical protein [Candidatus Gottesmanbacteria bacterium]